MPNVLQVNFAETEFLGTEPNNRRRDSVDWEQSLFQISEGSARARPRGHLRVARVSLHGLRKHRHCS